MNRASFIASLRRRCPDLDPYLVELIAGDADQYAAHEAERIAHPPYRPAHKIDLGHEKAKQTRSDEKEPA